MMNTTAIDTVFVFVIVMKTVPKQKLTPAEELEFFDRIETM